MAEHGELRRSERILQGTYVAATTVTAVGVPQAFLAGHVELSMLLLVPMPLAMVHAWWYFRLRRR
jgi:hypothetical protein